MQNSPSPEELHAFDREHFLHPWHDMNAWRGYDNMLVEAAQGIYLYDETGKKFIDGPRRHVVRTNWLWSSRDGTGNFRASSENALCLALYQCDPAGRDFGQEIGRFRSGAI